MPRLQLRDIILYYEEAGQGEPLVLVTGIGSDLQSWALTVPELSRHFRVITFDNRGAGRSSAPDRPYSIEGMAEDVVSLLDALEIDKAHVLGLSMGGYIAQELALHHPDRVDRLVLLSTAPTIDGYGRAILDALMRVRKTNISREGFMRVMAPLVYSPEFLEDHDRLERAITTSLANPYPQQDHAYLRQAQAIMRFDAAPRLGDLKQQTLVVHGVDDTLIPIRNGHRLAELIPNADIKELPGGHLGALEHASEYNAAFLEFLGATAAAASS